MQRATGNFGSASLLWLQLVDVVCTHCPNKKLGQSGMGTPFASVGFSRASLGAKDTGLGTGIHLGGQRGGPGE